MTTNLRQRMREMTEGYGFKKRMTNHFKSRSCECGDELLKRGSELCERCADKEIQEDLIAQLDLETKRALMIDFMWRKAVANSADDTSEYGALVREAINSRPPFVRLEQ